jgi:hypothetical protein
MTKPASSAGQRQRDADLERRYGLSRRLLLGKVICTLVRKIFLEITVRDLDVYDIPKKYCTRTAYYVFSTGAM